MPARRLRWLWFTVPLVVKVEVVVEIIEASDERGSVVRRDEEGRDRLRRLRRWCGFIVLPRLLMLLLLLLIIDMFITSPSPVLLSYGAGHGSWFMVHGSLLCFIC